MLKKSPYLTAFVGSRKWFPLGALPEAIRHLAVTLMWNCLYEGNPVYTGPAWTQ